MTAIVWDDMASNTQSRRSGFQPPHTGQNLAWVETDVDMVIDLNEVRSGIRTKPFFESCVDCRPVRERMILARIRRARFVDPFSKTSSEIDFTKMYEPDGPMRV